ncbi:hypothetical protein FisN_21Lh032 [Fistulifera solaris]|uniref:Uncharacterized protein n=1 Tax=Fistulifera solaris TaxID=1519565 RepID=A0A1Z5KJS3_FISSO|nr:hypothetical protein FisN_21Lh032 [Fistulifera solaris]|eukprot:GAX26564.1 hypothetical protein FisN_21Lh032 [Fistulifera solaris]
MPSLPSYDTAVPFELLEMFVTQCIDSLQTFCVTTDDLLKDDGSWCTSLSQLRQCLLQHQHDCLTKVVSQWNKTQTSAKDELDGSSSPFITTLQVQEALRYSKSHSHLLDHAARLAFARLVVTTTTAQSTILSTHHQKHCIQRADFLEFCGLCLAAVQLPIVQQYLAHGREGSMPFAQQIGATTKHELTFPHERLEYMQQHFWNLLGYDVSTVKAELQRLFFRKNQQLEKNEFTDDDIVQSTFAQLVTSMNATITTATHQAQQQAFQSTSLPTPHSTNHDDATTRIVSVQYSESIILVDPDSGKGETVASSSSPRPPTHTLPIAAEQLQQEIWAELLSMRDEHRQETLQQAAALARHVQETAMTMSDLSERKQYLQSMDVATKKQLVMYKLWNDWIQRNGGMEPAIRHYSH